MKRLKHVGAEAFNAQRDALIAQYNVAKRAAADDPVKVAHGVIGEAAVREWLSGFLPKKFGVTKGHIITHNLNYEGPVEEWDIIIFDQLESPILYTRQIPEPVRAIPVEHVRGIVEVKSTFRRDMAKKVRQKIEKLRPFVGLNAVQDYPQYLTEPFVCTAVFFETDVENNKGFRAALDELAPLAAAQPCPFGFHIAMSQTYRDHSANLEFTGSDEPMGLSHELEVSSEFRYPDGKYGTLGCLGGWGCYAFAEYVFDLLAELNGSRDLRRVSSFYGKDYERNKGSRLFGPVSAAPE